MIVLDASAGLSAILASQATAAGDEFFARRPWPPLTAPAVFRLEVWHTMLRWERSGWLDAARAKAAWAKLATLVEIEPASSLDSAADEALALARVERLSLFDAFYLDLAMRLGATLASRDAALLAAAGRRGVPVEDLR